MAQINPNAGHVNRPLTNYAIAYTNQPFAADKLAPIVEVEHMSDTYKIFPGSNANRVFNLKIGAKQEPGELDRESTNATYKVDDFGLATRIPLAAMKNEDEPGLLRQQSAVADVMGTLMTEREVRVFGIAMNPANYATGNKVALASGQGWNNAAVDPTDTIFNAATAIRRSPNSRLVAVAGPDTWVTMRKNPKLLSRVLGGANLTNPADVTKEMMAALLEVDEFVVASAYKTATNPGQADAETRVVTDGFAIVSAAMTPTTESLHFMSTFRFYTPEVYTEVEKKRGVRGVWFARIAYSEVVQVVSNTAAFLVTNIQGA